MSVLSTGSGVVRMLLVILQLIEVIQPGVDADEARWVDLIFDHKQHTVRAVGKPHYFVLKLSNKCNLIITGNCKICQIE